MKCEDFPGASMAYLDGEMGEEGRARFEQHLATCPRCRAELERLREVKEVTARMKLVDLEERDWDLYWGRVYNRMERWLGWIFFSAGAVVVLAYGGWRALSDLWTDESIPLLLRIGIGCVGIGIVILFVSVARQRLYAWARDPYRRVRR